MRGALRWRGMHGGVADGPALAFVCPIGRGY